MYLGLVHTLHLVCNWLLLEMGHPGVRVALFCFKEPWLLKTIRIYSRCYKELCVHCTLYLSGFVWKWDTLGSGLPFFF